MYDINSFIQFQYIFFFLPPYFNIIVNIILNLLLDPIKKKNVYKYDYYQCFIEVTKIKEINQYSAL